MSPPRSRRRPVSGLIAAAVSEAGWRSALAGNPEADGFAGTSAGDVVIDATDRTRGQEAREQLQALPTSLRYRLARRIAEPLDRIRRVEGRPRRAEK